MQSAFHSGKALFQVVNDVINMLGADREADGVGLDALVEQLLSRKLAVGGGGRMDHQDFTSATFASREKISKLSINLWASS